MNTEERDRLVKLEQIVAGQKEDLDEIKATLKRLEALANMGKGAIGVFLKVGSVAVLAIGALAWVYEKIHRG